MTRVTIFGDGNMGSAIAGVLGADSVAEHITTSTVDGTVNGDLVVLAVPYPAVANIIETYGDQLAGKIVVDITNPLNFETFDALVVPADGSAAAEIATALPSSKVLKAFNTNFAATLAGKTVGPNTTTVLVAGDEADAKGTLIDAVTAGGLEALDVGGLSRARELEAIGFLQIKLAAAETVGWTGGLAVVK
jgi:8-hydroxy-5-deazaflavin:NADPH oxidoreductase